MNKVLFLLFVSLLSSCSRTPNQENLQGPWVISKIEFQHSDYTRMYLSNLIILDQDSICNFPTRTPMLSHLTDSVFGKWIPKYNAEGKVKEVEFQHWDTIIAGSYEVKNRIFHTVNGKNQLFGLTLENQKSTIVLRGKLEIL